jgi:6-phosphogluconolactonase
MDRLRLPLYFLMSLTVSASEHLIYLGTYTRSTSKGIHAVRLDPRTGALGQPMLVAATANPSFLALSPDGSHLYAVSESSTMAVPFAIDPATGSLTQLQSQDAGGKAPCHLVVDRTERTLVLAHYHSGIVAALPIRADGTLGAPASVIQHAGRSVHPARQEAPHAHSVTLSPDNRFVIVCDLGLDRIFTYALDAATARLTPAAVPFIAAAPGAGPRHAAFSTDGRHVFVINELDSTLVSYRYDAATGTLTPVDRQSTLPAGWTGESTTAEVRIHPNGRFVYGSNRGHDSIAIFAFDAATGELAPRGHMPTGGKNPRNFALSPDGSWLVAANQNSDNLRVFRVDAASGALGAVPGEATVPLPVCVLFAR